jgi:biotin synthase
MREIAYIDSLYNDGNLEDVKLKSIIESNDSRVLDHLYNRSMEKKTRYYDKSVYMRGLIEFTNICKQNCNYCGLRRDNKNVDRYRLTMEQIMDCCHTGYKLGYRTFVLQGGEDSYFTDEKLVKLITNIKSNHPEAAITLSIGEKSYESYEKYFHAGADRFLLRHETADKDLYESLHPGMSFNNRIRCLNDMKKIGYQIGAGFMTGLPGQTAEHLVKDLRFLKTLDPQMIGIGPFIPHSETPLGNFTGGTVNLTLKMVALTRLMIPKALLPSTTALGTLDSLGREKAIKAGANVVMPNLSPINVREKYEIYENKICTGDEAAHCRQCIEKRINSTGSYVDMGRGDYYKWRMKNVY